MSSSSSRSCPASCGPGALRLKEMGRKTVSRTGRLSKLTAVGAKLQQVGKAKHAVARFG